MNDTGHFGFEVSRHNHTGRGLTQQSCSDAQTERWESRAFMCGSEQLVISTCTLRKVNMATLLFFPAMSPQSPEEALIIGNVTVRKFVGLENVTENSQVD